MCTIDIIVTLASIAAILAAYYNGDTDSRTRLMGFGIWDVTNPVFAFMYFGHYAGWWTITFGILPTVGMYLVFTGTSIRGTIRHLKEVHPKVWQRWIGVITNV